MKTLFGKWVAAFGICAIATFAVAERPRLLIVQGKGLETDPPLNVTMDVAQFLDEQARVLAVIYGPIDPLFRAAQNEGLLKDAPTKPDLEAAKKAARVLQADYLLWVDVEEKSERFLSVHKLYKGGKEIWASQSELSVKVKNQSDRINAIQSLGRTIATALEYEPLKELPSLGKATPNEALPGQQPIKPVEGAVTAPRVPVDELVAQAERFVEEGNYRAALLTLREAVDTDPTSAKARVALIRLYSKMGRPALAMQTAMSAAGIVKDPGMMVEVARAFAQGGKYNEARSLLNDALMLAPESEDIRIAMGELLMAEANPVQALDHFNAAAKSGKNASAFAMRALCRGLLGGTDGAKLDYSKAVELSAEAPKATYERAMSILDRALGGEGDLLRGLFQRGIVRRDSVEVRDSLAAQERFAQATLAIIEGWDRASRYNASHDQRVLALNLLLQCVTEFRTYLGSGDEQDLVNARLTLGEALREMSEAKAGFEKELSGTQGSSSARV